MTASAPSPRGADRPNRPDGPARRDRPVVRGVVDPRARFVVVAVLAFWLALPVLLRDNLAQDALPYVVAGQMVDEAPDQIYAADAADLYDLPPRFATRSCELAPAGTECDDFVVAFVSSPPSLPFAFLLGKLGGMAGIFVARLLAAASLAGGMWLLWRRATDRSAAAAVPFAAATVLLTPFALVPITLGQTSPYLFLLACLGVSATSRPARAVAVAGLFSLITLLKLFPAVAGLVLLRQRRWRLVGAIVAVTLLLAAIAAALGPTAWYDEFVTSARLMERYSLVNPYNGAVMAMAAKVSPSLTTGAPYVVLLATVVALVGAGWWVRVRHAADDVQWAYALAASLCFVPLVWWHYLWVGFAAVAIALMARPPSDPRRWWLLTGLAAVTIPISIPNGTGNAVPWAQFLFLVATLGLTVALARPRSEAPPAADPAPAR